MIIYELRIPPDEDSEAFVAFMQTEYFPAVHKGQTRVGQVTALTLGQKEGDEFRNEYLLQIGWDGFPTDQIFVDDQEVVKKFEAFHPRLTPVGFYTTVAAWSQEIEKSGATGSN
jgi:hypothetical protein